MEVSEGRAEELIWPTTRLAIARPPEAGRDLILLHGIEPNMRWGDSPVSWWRRSAISAWSW